MLCYIFKRNWKKEKVDQLFNPRASRQDIDQIVSEVEWSGRDIFKNFYLWLGGIDSIENELSLIKYIKKYNNIAYSRRQSLKTISDLCINLKDSDEFKGAIEAYFKFTETTFILDNIIHQPGSSAIKNDKVVLIGRLVKDTIVPESESPKPHCGKPIDDREIPF